MSNSDVIDRLVNAYNAHDADGFAALFAVDGCAYEHPGVLAQAGREAIGAFYVRRFAESPGLRTEVRHRIDLGQSIVDHEFVHVGGDRADFHTVAIYHLAAGEITRLDLMREQRD
ncbi:SgcJ/EcaC family oxidoreductase [Deinococcus sp.]|uniref:nuclear transport factor 2 family protein n=1 Tax=Deinococcus sp. TaxID=47478 RepID=UPI003C79AB06